MLSRGPLHLAVSELVFTPRVPRIFKKSLSIYFDRETGLVSRRGAER